MEILFWVVCILWVIVLVFIVKKIIKYEEIIKDFVNADVNKLYQENKKLKEDNQYLSYVLQDIQAILDDFKENEN